MLNIVNVGYDSTNYYVIETAATKLLVDVGFPGILPKLHHALKRTGIALTAITYLLITHYHPDHAGLAQELKYQGIKLIVLAPQVAAIPQLKRHMKPQYHYQEITLDDNVTISLERSASRENLTLADSLPHERSYPVVAPPGRVREPGGGCAAVRSTLPRQVKAARGPGLTVARSASIGCRRGGRASAAPRGRQAARSARRDRWGACPCVRYAHRPE